MGKLFVNLGGGGGVSSDELTASLADVRKGKTVVASDTGDEIGEGTIEDQAGGTYKSTTANQTISCKDKYMTGDIVIEGDSDLKAANIAKGVNILGVTGTHYGNKKAISAVAYYLAGQQNEYTQEEASFTMPADGVVYYGGFSASYGTSGVCTCEIHKNGSVVDSRNITNEYLVRGTMFNQSFTAKAGDVIKVKSTATAGTFTSASIQAVIIY